VDITIGEVQEHLSKGYFVLDRTGSEAHPTKKLCNQRVSMEQNDNLCKIIGQFTGVLTYYIVRAFGNSGDQKMPTNG